MFRKFIHPRTEEVRVNIKDINQLFNSLDPSPFMEKDLDHDAIEYIFSSYAMHHNETPIKMIIHLPNEQKSKFNEKEIIESIHHYFQYEKMLAKRNIKRKIKEGQTSLFIGLTFLIICLLSREWMFLINQTLTIRMISEALLIFGWVSMWKPISNILYDWWPIYDMKRTYEKISKTEIDFKYG